MTPLEVGSTIGAALIGGGAVVALIYRFKKNGSNGSNEIREIQKEQTRILQEIRDNMIKLNYEISKQFIVQNEKLVTMSNSLSSLHERLNGRIDRQP